ncbi:MAG: ATP-binding protein [Cyclobacteriaceae bacterium]|nr:ATP-binding protein [Cyclobacteriaceae bacterium]
MIPRKIEPHIHDLFRHFPVLFVTGPRQSGKTTLVKTLFKQLPYVLLEVPETRRLALEDPRTFLANYPSGAILDEVQNAPELFSYLQGIVDDDRSTRFVLTGSQNFLLNERISQSLAGRAGVCSLLPLSVTELPQARLKADEFIFKGFYPELYSNHVPERLFYPSYIQTYLERDVRSLKNIGDLAQFSLFLKLCAGRIGQVLNVSSLANDAGISVNTAKAWLSVLEASYLVYRLQPHYKNFNKRLIKSPKLYFTDTGLACNLLGIKTAGEIQGHFAMGQLFENFVIMECYKQRLNKGIRNGLYYWKDNKGIEIDLLIENGTEMMAIEIKAGKTFSPDFFKNLRYWSGLSKAPAKNCVVIYGGNNQQMLPYGMLRSWSTMSDFF